MTYPIENARHPEQPPLSLAGLAVNKPRASLPIPARRKRANDGVREPGRGLSPLVGQPSVPPLETTEAGCKSGRPLFFGEAMRLAQVSEPGSLQRAAGFRVRSAERLDQTSAGALECSFIPNSPASKSLHFCPSVLLSRGSVPQRGQHD